MVLTIGGSPGLVGLRGFGIAVYTPCCMAVSREIRLGYLLRKAAFYGDFRGDSVRTGGRTRPPGKRRLHKDQAAEAIRNYAE